MNTILALASVVIKELYRRKDFYVLFVLTALLTLVLASVNFFNEKTIVFYLKDMAMLLILVSALVIAISTTARQIHAERENRTIFPLLAKPVSRAQVVLGKFVGCWLACGLCLLVFYLFFCTVTASREGHFPALTYIQGLWLQWAMLAIVVSLTLLGSVLFAAPSSNTTIVFILVAGILLLGRHLNQVALQHGEPLRSIIYAIYFLLPHLEWFDIRDLLVYDQPPVGFLASLMLTLYAAIYTAFLLFASWMKFRRKALHL